MRGLSISVERHNKMHQGDKKKENCSLKRVKEHKNQTKFINLLRFHKFMKIRT